MYCIVLYCIVLGDVCRAENAAREARRIQLAANDSKSAAAAYPAAAASTADSKEQFGLGLTSPARPDFLVSQMQVPALNRRAADEKRAQLGKV